MLHYIVVVFYYYTDKMKKFLITIFVCVACLQAMAQDARIAHPFLWKSYYNPAYCGSERMYKADFGVQSTYSHKPSLFLDSHFSMEIPWETDKVAWGAGIKASNQYQGSGLLNISSISPMVSVGLLLYDKDNIQSLLLVGAEFDVYSTKTNYDKMVLGDQLDPYYGIYKDFSQELAYFADDNFWVFDMAVGIYGRTQFQFNMLKYGFSIFHLISDRERSFYSNEESVIYMPAFYNRRFCANIEYQKLIELEHRSGSVVIGGYGIYEYQGGMHDIQFGLNTSYKWFTLGIGAKVERYIPAYTVSNIIFSAVYSQWFNDKKYNLKLAYSFEFPITQGLVSETLIHSLSLHFCYNYAKDFCSYTCKTDGKLSDDAWYIYSNSY